MGQDSNIEWTTHTFNPWRGCTKVSAGCQHCYADTLSKRNPLTLGVWGPTGTRVVAAEAAWREPLKWDRAAKAVGERHRVFCASLADVFEDWTEPMVDAAGRSLHFARPGAWGVDDRGAGACSMTNVRHRLFGVIRDTPHLDWLLLTKRPENIDGLSQVALARPLPPNVWIGTSVEDQKTADERIPHLLTVPAAVRFLSCEPLLGPVNLGDHLLPRLGDMKGAFRPDHQPRSCRIDWVIVGGESGPGARPMHPDWARSLRDQCRAAGVPFFFKQWGEWADYLHARDELKLPVPVSMDAWGTLWPPRFDNGHPLFEPQTLDARGQPMLRVGKKAAGRLLDGREWDEFPEPNGGPRA